MNAPATASEICRRAGALVGGERAVTHGDVVDTHATIARLWSAYLGFPVDAVQVALCLALLKIARTRAGAFNPDDFIDLAGYAGCAGEVAARLAGAQLTAGAEPGA